MKLHPSEGDVGQESVAENHRHHSSNFCHAIAELAYIYGRWCFAILHLEQQSVCVIVEGQVADPGHEHWNSLQNYSRISQSVFWLSIYTLQGV